MLFLTSPDGSNYNYSIIKSVGAGLVIDVGSAGATNALVISSAGVVNAPQGLQVGGNSVVSTAGGQTIGGITYFSNGESLNVYGIRGRFGNEYLHLYNKVGVGNPGGWGQGEGNTPAYGLSVYGGANFAYGNNADSTFNGIVYSTASFRAPIYYDSQNTNYYGDFAGTSNLNVLYTNYLYIDGTQLTGTQTQLLKNTLDVTTLPYKVDITVNGDANTFYAVQFWGGDQDVWRRIIIKRGYGETAPWDPIGTGVHHGGLLLDWEGNFGGWGGAEYADRIRVFNESYTNVCADMFIYSHSMGYVFMLRGGGAVYHLFSDQPINGFYQSGAPDILYSTSTLSYDDTWSGTNQYDVPAPAPLSLAQVNSSRIDGLRTKKQSLLDNRYLRQGIDISGIGNITTTNSYATNFIASNAFYLNGTSYYLNSANGGIYTNVRFETAGNLVVQGNSYLGNGNGDATYINDILYVGANDSGDAHMYFGEDSSGWYGLHWYWDSAYTVYLYGRNAGTDTEIMRYTTNSNAYVEWRRHFHMNNYEINYLSQLHFNAGTRFYGNDSHYLIFRTDDTSYGAIQVRDGNSTVRGYSAYYDGSGFGLLNSSGNWGIRLNPGNVGTELFYAGGIKLATLSEGTRIYGNLHLDDNYGYGIVGVYSSSRYQGVWAMGNSYKLSADGTSTGNLYGLAWSHPDAGGQTKAGLEHQLLVMNYGVTQTAIGTGIWTAGLITTTSYGTSANWNTAYSWGNHASAGYLTGITSGQVTGALGYTPYNSSNPSGYITSSSLSSYLPLAGGTMSGKILSVSTGSGTYDTAIEIREQGYVTTSQSAWGYSPAMTFHWGGRYGVRFGLRSDGLMAVDDAPIALRSWVSAQGFITGYTETDTLASVTGRGATTASQMSFTKTDDHAISVGTIRGRAVGVQTGEFIQLYERVNIGGPNGWGAANTAAPSYGLSVYGGANIGYGNNASLFAYAYRGNANVAGTGEASYHPAGIYSTGTNWLYGTMYKNNTGIYDVSEMTMYSGPTLSTYNTRNLIVRALDNNADVGILGQKSGGGFAFQIYGTGSSYGFLNGTWAAWDIRKAVNGAMYMNDNDSYYLQTNSTSNFYALNIQGNAVVHAGNIGSQTVSNSNHLNSTRDTPSGKLQYWDAPGLGIDEAPSGDWHNTIRMGHGSPLSYYSNTLAIRMTGSGVGDIYTQTIMNGNRQGWKKHWNDGNHGSGSGLDADLLDGQQGSYYQPASSAITTSNIGSQSVSYATTAGTANAVAWTNVSSRPTALSQFTNDLGNYGGFLTSITAHSHAISDVTGLQTALDGKQASLGFTPYNSTNPSGYITSSGSISGSAGSVSGLTLTSSANGINPDSVTQNQIGYNTSVSLFGQTDGGLYSSAYSSSWIHQIYGDFRTGQIAIRGKNSGSWQAWRTVLDSSNYTSYAPGLTGSGASGTWGINISGSAGSVAWTNVSSRPTNLSQFTNDLGNYGGWQSASTAITTSNIGSQSVSYASTAGSAPANGGNSSTVGGYAVSGSVGANTVVIRDSNGYIYAHYINSNVSESENPTINSFYTSNGDGWLRKSSVAHVKSQLGLGSLAYSSATIPTNNNQLTNGAGYITGINSGNVTTALGFTPYNATNPSGYITSSASISGNAATATNVAWTGVTGRPTALSQFSNDLGNYGGWLTTGGKAADSELFDGTDSIYFVKGNGTNALGRTTTNNSGGNSAGGLSSGFYDGSGMSNMPTSDWYHLIVNSHHNSATSNQYEFQLATAFWDKSNFYVRSISPGDVGPWRTLIHNGNIGSQSVSYATTSQQLNKYGDISGQDWNTYYINGKMIVSSVYGGSGPNFPTGAYNYGAMLSYGVTGSDFFQVYFPENGALQGGAFRKLHYRTGWNGSWSAWKSVVDQEGQVCTIAGSNQTGIEIHSNVGYNQDPLTYFLMRGQADTSWKAFKVRLTGDAGGQDIEFRRIAENGTDSRMWYVPRGGNTVNFEYPIVQPSDSRLKDNITPISTPVDKIKSLRGVEFDWNSGEQVGTHDVGLIAQDVEAVLPEAVTTQEDGYKNLAYTKVIPLLVEAMKEQQAMIEALKAEIELLKNK
jgi:hypothetical protein